MSVKLLQATSEVQAAIYRVALSLDAFLLNGIQFGLLQNASFPGFFDKTSGSLLRDLATLEGLVLLENVGCKLRAKDVLEALKAECGQVIESVARLSSWRALPVEQMRELVVQIPPEREKCVHLIQELESCFGTPDPFYQTRPIGSTAAVTEFLAHLEVMFTTERATSQR